MANKCLQYFALTIAVVGAINWGLIGCYFGLVIFLFGMAEFLDNLGEFGKYGAYILAGCLNVMFLSYDFSLVTGMEFYRVKVLPKLHLQV